MKFNSSCFNTYISISPACSKGTSKNANQSTFLNQNSYFEELKDSISTQQPSSSSRSSSTVYIAKLQSKILEAKKKIETQNYQIDSLTAQANHLVQICDQQKLQLCNLNIQTIREQYDQQIRQLVEQKQKITDLIYTLNEEYRVRLLQQQSQLDSMKDINSDLTQKIQQALSEKEALLRKISELDQQNHQNQEVILQQEDRIDQLRNIERKLFIALKERKKLETKT